MTKSLRIFPAALTLVGILTALALVPGPARAQCGMMGGGGRGGMSMSHGSTAKSKGSDKKLRQSVDRVLADERGRAMLVAALLADGALLDDLLARLVADPDGRALVARRLDAPSSSIDGRPAPAAPAAVYACPMHPEVTSANPSDCPKCGMALVRRDSRRE